MVSFSPYFFTKDRWHSWIWFVLLPFSSPSFYAINEKDNLHQLWRSINMYLIRWENVPYYYYFFDTFFSLFFFLGTSMSVILLLKLVYVLFYGNDSYVSYFTRCTTHFIIQWLGYDSISHIRYTIKLSLSTHVSELRAQLIFPVSEFTSS